MHKKAHPKKGKGKESDPTDASANVSANALVDTPPTHYRRVGQHTTDASADTLQYFPFITIILLFLSVGSKNNFIRKDENVIAK